MSSNPSPIDQLTVNQTQKEALANALFGAASSAMLYGRREQTSAGLVWGYYGGVLKTGSGYLTISNGNVSLTDAATNYVEADLSTGAVSANTSAFTSGRLALFTVVCAGGVATSWSDHRQALLTSAAGAAAFTDLTDAPSSYTGEAGKMVVVNSGETALEFVDPPIPGGAEDFTDLGDVPSSYTGSGGLIVKVKTDETGLEFVAGGAGVDDFTDLGDVPSSYTGQAGKVPAVNSGETGLEFVDLPTPGGAESFTDLDDVPSSYGGNANKLVAVNGAASALIFVDAPTPGAEDFTDLGDVPAAYTGASGQMVVVNSGESGLEFADVPTDGHAWVYDEVLRSGLDLTLRGGRITRSTGAVAILSDQVIAVDDGVFSNYVEADRSTGTIYVNGTAFTAGRLPLYEVYASSGTITSLVDHRQILNGMFRGSFATLEDSAGAYTGQAGKFVRVNTGETGLEYATGGGGGAEDFTDLNDVPNNYTGSGSMVVRVKADESGLEFVTGGGGAESFTDLDDVPSSYTGQAGKIPSVNGAENALEFVDFPAGLEPSDLYAPKSSTTSGLTWGYYGGSFVGYYQNPMTIADGTVSLTDDTTNYVQVQRSNGAVTVNTTGFDRASRLPIATIETASGAITSYIDERQKLVGAQGFYLGVTDYQKNVVGSNTPLDVYEYVNGMDKKCLFFDDYGFFYRPVPYRLFDLVNHYGTDSLIYTEATITIKGGIMRTTAGTEVELTDTTSALEDDAVSYVCVERATGDYTIADTVADPGLTDFPDETVYLPLWKITTVGGAITDMEDHRVVSLAGPTVDSIVATFDGGGSALVPGSFTDVVVPYAATITGATMLADASGSLVVDVWVDTYANFPPTDADSITASAPPTIISSVKSQDLVLTGWTKNVAAGSIVRFSIDSATTITRATLSLTVTRK